MQVRSYCRGIVVRAVSPEIRLKLFYRLRVEEMTSLRSFLDPPVAKGKTIKGSGKVGYHLHSRNHTSHLVLPGSLLEKQVMFFHLYLYASFCEVIHKRILISRTYNIKYT